MNKVLHIAQERGLVSFGWLDAKYSFSFGNYYNPDKMNFGALRVVFDEVRDRGISVMPTSPEVVGFLRKNRRKYKDLLPVGINI